MTAERDQSATAAPNGGWAVWRRLERGAVIANLAGQAKVKHGVNYASVSLARYATRARVCVCMCKGPHLHFVRGARHVAVCLCQSDRGPARPHRTLQTGVGGSETSSSPPPQLVTATGPALIPTHSDLLTCFTCVLVLYSTTCQQARRLYSLHLLSLHMLMCFWYIKEACETAAGTLLRKAWMNLVISLQTAWPEFSSSRTKTEMSVNMLNMGINNSAMLLGLSIGSCILYYILFYVISKKLCEGLLVMEGWLW